MKYNKFLSPWQVSDSTPAKMVQLGAKALSNAELLATVSGIPVPLAAELLSEHGNDLSNLARLSVDQLANVKGMGRATALRIIAAFEIGNRRRMTTTTRPKVRCSQDAHKIVEHLLTDLHYEEFHIILLNRSNQLIETVRISQGGISGTVTDVRLILNAAVQKLASGIILVHNHPSGNLSPSEADLKITRKIKEAAALLDLTVLDHLILADSAYLSMADDNLMP